MKRRGATLLELMAATVVMAVAAAALAPVMAAAGESYASASRADRALDETLAALDRVAAMLREAPAGSAAGTLGISEAGPGILRFADGTGVEAADGALALLAADGARFPLAANVRRFEVRPLAEDGVTDLTAEPQNAHVFQITLGVEGLELTTRVFPRARLWSAP